MPNIINSDQSGFIPNRFISDNIRRTLNIIDYSQKNNKDLLLLTHQTTRGASVELSPRCETAGMLPRPSSQSCGPTSEFQLPPLYISGIYYFLFG